MSPKVTPRDFFLWLGAMLAFYISFFSFLTLFFEYIDLAYPDELMGYVDPYSSSIRWAIASLIVLFPLFLFLMHLIRKGMAADPSKKDIWVRRWILVFTIFVATITLAVDLVTLINTFLGGEITMRFFLKVAVVFLAAGGGLLHFLGDLHGWWNDNPTQLRMVGGGVTLAIIIAIVSGFLIMGSPTQMRLYRYDDQKVSDLQSIQWQIIDYWQQKEKLPSTLGDLSDTISGTTLPTDPQSKQSYEYAKIASSTFRICATFNADTSRYSSYGDTGYQNGVTMARPTMASPISSAGVAFTGPDLSTVSWWHSAGHMCFTRIIDPQRYPFVSKIQKMPL